MFTNLHSASSQLYMDLTTKGVVLTDAIKFIEWSNEKLNFSQKKEQKSMKSLKNLITAPAEALLSTPEDPPVLEGTELAYSEMQQNKRPFGPAFHGNKSLD